MTRHLVVISVLALVSSCVVGEDEPPPPDEDENGDTPVPPDDMPGPIPDQDPNWRPRAFGKSRFVVFYQVSPDALDTYADPTTGLPQVADHGYIFSISHATAFANRETGDRIHARRPDFYYAPAFDVWEREGWITASDTQLRAWAHDFRDQALNAHADMFTFNESPTTTAENTQIRVQIIKILRYLNEPDAQGRRLRGVFFFTHKPGMPENWTSPATDFWTAIDDTCDAVVVEHYHSQGYVCSYSESALSEHLFALRRWLDTSGNAAKVSIANRKYTVLHSARLAPGSSGWAGADSNVTSLAEFQRALSKLTKITRNTPGGLNRISYAPTTSSITAAGVHPRIALLARWHYGKTSPLDSETSCVAGAQVNCTCSAP